MAALAPDLESWLEQLRERAEKKRDEALHPAVRPLADLVERDAVVRVFVNQMVEQEPRGPESAQHLKDVPDLLRMLSEAVQVAPEYSEDAMLMTPSPRCSTGPFNVSQAARSRVRPRAMRRS